MVGMYLTYIGFLLFGLQNYALFWVNILLSAFFSWICFLLCIRPSLDKDKSIAIIVTVGLSLFLQNLVTLIFGSIPLMLQSPIKSVSVSLGSLAIGLPRVIAFFSALVLTLLVSFITYRTSLGRQMRATSENPEVARSLGINTEFVYAIAWVIGIAMTSLAGLLTTPMYMLDPSAGATFRAVGLMAVVLGSLGNIPGAFLGGVILGVVESLTSSYISPNLGPLGIFVLFLGVLLIKPYGLFGQGAREA
jgi:branched-chain amino acid transport system permease protein